MSYLDYVNHIWDLDDPKTRELIDIFREATGRTPNRGTLGQMHWRVDWEGYDRQRLLDAYRAPDRPNPAPVAPHIGRRGVDLPVDALHGGWLYTRPFWGPANVFVLSQDDLEIHLTDCRLYGNICVSVVNFVGGDQYSPRHFGWDNMDHVVNRLRYIDSQGLANIVFCMGNEYLKQELGFPNKGRWEDRLWHRVRETGRLIAPHTVLYIPLTERGKTLTSTYNGSRRKMYTAAREGMGNRGWIGAHELAREGVYFEDLKDAGACMPCIQTGFDASDDAIRQFIREDSDRWRALERRGNFSGPTKYCAFEHSIPDIDPRWQPTQAWEQANHRGRVALDAGADLDFSGGQIKGA